MDDKLKLVLVDDQEDILETLEIKIPDLCDFDIEMFTFTNLQDATDFIFENLKIEINLIELSRKYAVKKLLFLGSSCIYPKFSKQPIGEGELLKG